MKTKIKLFLFLLLFTSALTFTLLSCSSPTNPDLLPSLTISVDGVTSTEVFIKLSTNNVTLPASVSLSRNNKQINSFTLITADTTIVDNNLNPNQSYTYSAKLTDANNKRAVSVSVLAQTMDTTSHNFTWQTYTFGGANGSSVLNDVAIINENDIWAVGEIHTTETDQFDSNGVWVQPYNAVHWDGNTWELKRIMFYIDQDQPTAGKTSSPSQTCFVFDNNKFAISSNVQTAIFTSNEEYSIIKMGFAWKNRFTINSMWGTSSEDFYIVGNNGNIAHYNGRGWQKLESGTELNINDIWGIINPTTGAQEIYFTASNFFKNDGVNITRLDNFVPKQLTTIGLGSQLASVWFKDSNKLYVAGTGISQINISASENRWRTYYSGQVTKYFTSSIRGNALNDIIAVGSFGEIVHFNGIGWKNYFDQIPFSSSSEFNSVSIKGNIAAAVGFQNAKGWLAIGKR